MSIDKLLTLDDLLSLSGAVTATLVLTNGLCHAFTLNRRVVGLAIALIISFFGFYIGKSYSISQFFLSVVNGFVIYISALGLTHTPPPRPRPKLKQANTPSEPIEETHIERKFWKRW